MGTAAGHRPDLSCARRARQATLRSLATLVPLALLACGCTPLGEYLDNGFKVGPEFCPPPAPVAPQWIDADDRRVRSESDDLSAWWQVFNDPVLDDLICTAYKQNLTLREAGFRVLQARAQLGIAVGELFPQSQSMSGQYSRNVLSGETADNIFQFNVPGLTRYFDQWDYQFGLAWELDFWGRFRRAVEANAANLDASVADYDDVLVTLLGDVASTYVRLRSIERQIAYTQENVALQDETLTIVDARFRANVISALDPHQARSTLAQTKAQVQQLEIDRRIAQNQLCVLMGMPVQELSAMLGSGPIPVAPADVAAGIPADLLSRRPDIRRAERLAAAQSARIGVAVSELYPHIAITGTIGYAAENLSDLVQPGALSGAVGPGFQWNVLNYGRLANNVRLQDARLAELIADYQDTVLNAGREVEDGLVRFLRSHARVQLQGASVAEAEAAVKLALVQYKAGTVDFTRVTQLELALVEQKNILAQAHAELALGLVQVYKALGGGWEIKCTGCEPAMQGGDFAEGVPIEEVSAPVEEPSGETALELAP